MENPSGRKILWENTLDARLDVVFHKKTSRASQAALWSGCCMMSWIVMVF
ncbi:unnamed protein product, partial [Vitis vinifera]